MHEFPARGPTRSETGQRVAEMSRCTLAVIQTYLRFRPSPLAFLMFHYYLEHANAEAASSIVADTENRSP